MYRITKRMYQVVQIRHNAFNHNININQNKNKIYQNQYNQLIKMQGHAYGHDKHDKHDKHHNQPQYQQVPINTGQIMMVQAEGIYALANLPSIYIKQKWDKWESLGFCEKSNTYYVYPSDHQGTKPDFKEAIPMFKCKEKSSCWQRNFLPAACRGFEMKIKQYNPNNPKDDDEKKTVMKFDRPYKCTFLCCNRPELTVYKHDASGSSPIGSILFPCMVCQVGVVIRDTQEQVLYNVFGSCCQLGFFCKLPCKACQTFKFLILDPQNQNQPVGELWKESAGCCQACLGDADNFKVIYPQNATPEHKALLLASALFIDYNYFEESPADQQNSSND